MQIERYIKKLSRAEKEKIINEPLSLSANNFFISTHFFKADINYLKSESEELLTTAQLKG